jgi:hypothetical protein
MILILPSLFGLTLVGEGLHKCINDEWTPGLISIIFGTAFIGAVVFAFLFFTSYFNAKG